MRAILLPRAISLPCRALTRVRPPRGARQGLELVGARLAFLTPGSAAAASLEWAPPHPQADVAPVLVLALRGYAAHASLQRVLGPEDPELARRTDALSVRALFGRDREHNVVRLSRHSSALHDITLWFGAHGCDDDARHVCPCVTPPLPRAPHARVSTAAPRHRLFCPRRAARCWWWVRRWMRQRLDRCWRRARGKVCVPPLLAARCSLLLLAAAAVAPRPCTNAAARASGLQLLCCRRVRDAPPPPSSAAEESDDAGDIDAGLRSSSDSGSASNARLLLQLRAPRATHRLHCLLPELEAQVQTAAAAPGERDGRAPLLSVLEGAEAEGLLQTVRARR